jgi:hypothetical protein
MSIKAFCVEQVQFVSIDVGVFEFINHIGQGFIALDKIITCNTTGTHS